MSPEMSLQTCNINRTMLPEQCYREQDAFEYSRQARLSAQALTKLTAMHASEEKQSQVFCKCENVCQAS